MHFRAEEWVVYRGSVASSYKYTDAGVVHPRKSLVKELTVILKEMEEGRATKADNSRSHMDEEGNPGHIVDKRLWLGKDWLELQKVKTGRGVNYFLKLRDPVICSPA